MKRISIILSVFFAFLFSNAQTTIKTCSTDTINLVASNLKAGTLEWEKSYNNINWIKIPGAQDTVYTVLSPTESMYFRAVNKFSGCDPNTTASTLVLVSPKANAGSDRIVNDNFTFLSGNTSIEATCQWTVIEGEGGILENPNAPNTKFTGIPSNGETNGPSGIYKLQYELKNTCGVSWDTIEVKFVYNKYYEKIVVIDETDIIKSSPAEIEEGKYVIEFTNTIPEIDNQTILIGLVGEGFMRKVDSVTQSGNTFVIMTSQAKIEDVLIQGGISFEQLEKSGSISESLRVIGYKQLNKMPTRRDLLYDESLKKGNHFFIIEEKIESPLKGVSITERKRNARIPAGDEEALIDFNFDGTKLYDKNGIKAVLDGNLSFKPNITGYVDIGLFDTEAHIGVNNATMNFRSKLTVTADYAYDSKIDSVTLGTIRKSFVIVVAGVPTLIQIKTQLDVETRIQSYGRVQYINEYEKTYKVNAGIKYEDGEWSSYFDESESSSMTNNLKAQASVSPSFDIGPIVYFTVNGLAAPYISTKMTTDIRLCASTENLKDFNVQIDANLGAKLTIGIHAYMFKKKLFDWNVTWENRKLLSDQFPYALEYISGNSQQYKKTIPLAQPLRVRAISKYGLKANLTLVTFEVRDNSGIISQEQVWTDNDGYAQAMFTPTASDQSEVWVYAKDCNFNYLIPCPLIFTFYEEKESFDCSKTTLSASMIRKDNKIELVGFQGKQPYTYSTDLQNFSYIPQDITFTPGQEYSGAIKDANGCIAYANYRDTQADCSASNLQLNTEQFGNNLRAMAQGGKSPYTYALDDGTYTSSAIFNNIPVGTHILKVKDANGCEATSKSTITDIITELIPYFTVDAKSLFATTPIEFSNLSTNAGSYTWDFGDGNTSTQVSPVHTYANAGTYTVTLTVYKDTKADTFQKQLIILPALTFSQNSVSLNKGQTTQITITAGSGLFSVISDRPDVATATLSSNVITVTGVSEGTCRIIVTDRHTGQTTNIQVTVSGNAGNTVTDIDGNVYTTVTIGTQTWMVENLKTTRYRNGDAISEQWAYNNDENNVAKYGRLYTWYAATDSRSIAPAGWHVPTDAEWTTLVNYLIANGYNYDGTTFEEKIAKALAATTDWLASIDTGDIGNDLTKNNSSGFTALPGGFRDENGLFEEVGRRGFWLSSTGYLSTNAMSRYLRYDNSYLFKYLSPKDYGFSVRCVKGNETDKQVPSVETGFIGNITSSTAIGGGNVRSDGGTAVTERGICWNTSGSPTITDSKTSDGTGPGTFTGTMTGLTAGTTYYVRAYATNNLGTSYGDVVVFTTTGTYGTMTDIDGNVYKTVTIGNQTWMVENLKTTRYRNGDLIGTTSPATKDISSETKPKYQWAYNGDENNAAKYGRLYTWYAATDSRGIAPTGWHIPTAAEWTILENYLIANGYNYDGTTTGNKIAKALAATTDWNTYTGTGTLGADLTKNNSSGFTALPGGFRGSSFGGIGDVCYWWSSTENGVGYAWSRKLVYYINSLARADTMREGGFSVRCIKD